jgi:hypothetical protein
MHARNHPVHQRMEVVGGAARRPEREREDQQATAEPKSPHRRRAPP